MISVLRLVGIGMVFCVACLGWMTLGAITTQRTGEQSNALGGEVVELWGNIQEQQAPQLTHSWTVERLVTRTEEEGGKTKVVQEQVQETLSREVSPNSTVITANLGLDQRLKGLMWYSLYNIDFDGRWTYKHTGVPGVLQLSFRFPNADGLYDNFRFEVNGADRARELRPENGSVSYALSVVPDQEVSLAIGYRSRGKDIWRYVPANGVANLENFSLNMTTDFEQIDYPGYAMSPSARTRTDKGWQLAWEFKQLVTGHSIGMVMPIKLQPGELASELAFSAPISLLFYFLVIFVLATLRGLDLHPVNYLFIAGAFFAFHLLFAYSVDQLEVKVAFALSSAVSIALVVSYLRLVVSSRFAFVEAALAQLVYLVVFSLAHFWDGYTGLTVTVLSILTLFVLMQLTGRVKWSEVLGSNPSNASRTSSAGGTAVSAQGISS